MASIDSGGGDSGHKKGPGVKKAKKLSTRVDMTPMVDVVFQLMTFLLFSMQMTTGQAVDVPPARHGVGVDEAAFDAHVASAHVKRINEFMSKIGPLELNLRSYIAHDENLMAGG